MSVRIRLQRRGRTHYATYAIVAADSRAPRDGKFIEKLGTYNPNTNPASIELNFDRALYWVQQGAQPSDTTRAIMSHEGVMMMDHLLRGAKKGAFDEAEAKNRFEAWKSDKLSKIQAQKDKISDEEKAEIAKSLKAEQKVNEDRAKALQERLIAESKKDEEEVVEETPEEVKEEVVEETKEKVKEETKEEAKEEEKPKE